ncbi:MAG TPA: DUF72 domain-containing protein [Methylomirabilota bacterium]|jgi:uncharacterized protein YecE (DUF72 family)|nr:DUF72 domain-containing protein [Methylomirabilota bacterium]
MPSAGSGPRRSSIPDSPDPDTPVILAEAPPGPAEYRVGCASWLDRALIASGRFYPRGRMSAEDRLRWYARFFDCVEVNATYYALPSPRNALLWVSRTPPRFLFHVKAYSLMTGHHPRVETLPPDVRLMLPDDVPLRPRGEVDRDRFPAEALARCFELFREGVAPLAAAGKLGYVLFQLAPWVRYDERVLEYLASLPRRLPGWTAAVEFRNASWIPERTDEVLRFLADHGLLFVGVDAPWQPFIPAATVPGWVTFRLHGQNVTGWLAQLAGKEPSVAEKYDYLYGPDEIRTIARRTQAFGGHARRVAVTFNNNNQDYPIQNALDLKELLGLATPGLDTLPVRRPARRRPGATAAPDLFPAEPDPPD